MTGNWPSTEKLAGASPSGMKRKKRLFFTLIIVSILLVATIIIGIVAGGTRSGHRNASGGGGGGLIISSPTTHAIVKSSCSNTLYPDLCYSSVAAVVAAGDGTKIVSQKDVVKTVLRLTKKAVEVTYLTIKKLTTTRKGLTKREKGALRDCLEMLDETLDDLKDVDKDLDDSTTYKESLSKHADHLKTLLSAAITNQETCLDGFSHDKADKQLREVLVKEEIHIEKMCSNALAMIKNMTTDIKLLSPRRILYQYYNSRSSSATVKWPEWLSVGDRRLLQSQTAVTPNVVVAADGTGDFRTVSAAVAAAPEGSSTRYIIRIKAGVYKENVEVVKKKTNLMFVGDGRTTTIITASRNVVDGSTTFNSATVAIVGTGFLARDITFENTAGPSKHQAVALRIGADLSAFYRCDMLAYQDTLYVHSNRQFIMNCFIAGTVDFIFGNAAVVLQDCDIHARRPNPGQKNMVTAQGRTDPNQNTGIVIQKCRIGTTSDLTPVISSFPTYLGRPWKEYSRTVVMQTEISNAIVPAGWSEWTGSFALSTLTYREYQNTGPGANTANRVTWPGFKVITSVAEAQQYTPGNFISGGTWLRATGFPFSLSL
ncbi:pectinesterase-like [Impatiens glandulifera]|uniref:pectinesterase-like n=1 Tax=Impatiens glandulifera TaxID=253017 RepID=UPI001FB0CA5B|nr:pectinesterase-like [Impatiens glandulifera]